MDTFQKESSPLVSALRKYSGKKIGRWAATLNLPETKADLALLRKYIGKDPNQVIDPWSVILDGDEEGLKLILAPHQNSGQEEISTLTRSEIALYHTFSLYALHQRSRTDPMTASDTSIGKALNQLAVFRGTKTGSTTDESDKIFRRLKAMAHKKTLKAMIPDLRGLISLLNEAKIPLDYPALAVDLFWLQNPRTKNRVLIHWINDFNKVQASAAKESKEK